MPVPGPNGSDLPSPYSGLRAPDIRKLCERRGIPTQGLLKKDLVNKLAELDRRPAATTHAAQATEPAQTAQPAATATPPVSVETQTTQPENAAPTTQPTTVAEAESPKKRATEVTNAQIPDPPSGPVAESTEPSAPSSELASEAVAPEAVAPSASEATDPAAGDPPVLTAIRATEEVAPSAAEAKDTAAGESSAADAVTQSASEAPQTEALPQAREPTATSLQNSPESTVPAADVVILDGETLAKRVQARSKQPPNEDRTKPALTQDVVVVVNPNVENAAATSGSGSSPTSDGRDDSPTAQLSGTGRRMTAVKSKPVAKVMKAKNISLKPLGQCSVGNVKGAWAKAAAARAMSKVASKLGSGMCTTAKFVGTTAKQALIPGSPSSLAGAIPKVLGQRSASQVILGTNSASQVILGTSIQSVPPKPPPPPVPPRQSSPPQMAPLLSTYFPNPNPPAQMQPSGAYAKRQLTGQQEIQSRQDVLRRKVEQVIEVRLRMGRLQAQSHNLLIELEELERNTKQKLGDIKGFRDVLKTKRETELACRQRLRMRVARRLDKYIDERCKNASNGGNAMPGKVAASVVAALKRPVL